MGTVTKLVPGGVICVCFLKYADPSFTITVDRHLLKHLFFPNAVDENNLKYGRSRKTYISDFP